MTVAQMHKVAHRGLRVVTCSLWRCGATETLGSHDCGLAHSQTATLHNNYEARKLQQQQQEEPGRVRATGRRGTALGADLQPVLRWTDGFDSTTQDVGATTSTSYNTPAKERWRRRSNFVRLDELCQRHFPQHSRSLLQSLILQGKVLVDGVPATKAGHPVRATAALRLTAEPRKYVCRAGDKLEAALAHFKVDVRDKLVLDAGLSAGGFTDCLLQHGARQVFGVDVGYNQVDSKLRRHPGVVVMERTNLRYLRAADLPCKVQVVTLDLSFISVLKVLPVVCSVLEPGGDLIVLIKPQFEAGREHVQPGGVIRDPQVHDNVIQSVVKGICDAGFTSHGVMQSPLEGAKSRNREFLVRFSYALNIEDDKFTDNEEDHVVFSQ